MALRLNKADTPVWVTDEDLARVEAAIVDPDPDVAYLIRPIRKADADTLRKPYVKMRFDSRSHKQVEAEMTREDNEALSLDTLDFVLREWRGFLADDGTAEPCTRENKDFLDTLRKRTLVHLAMLTQQTRAEDRAASFRATPGLGGLGLTGGGQDTMLPDGR